MIARRTAEPAFEPVTLAEAKLHLRVDHSEEDAYITSLITAARVMCEQRTGRALAVTGWLAYADCFTPELELPYPNTTTVALVSYIDVDGADQDLDPSEYEVDMVSQPARIRPITEWPATADRMNAVTVFYTSGYANAASVPTPLKQWILLAVGDMYENREAAIVGLSRMENPTAHRLLDGYRNYQ